MINEKFKILFKNLLKQLNSYTFVKKLEIMSNETEKTCIRIFADINQIEACRENLQAVEPSFARLAQILSLAANDVRLKILYLLNTEGELCPCDLSDILGMTVPAVSQHLRKLKDANVIQSRREAQTIFYSLKAEHLDIISPLFQHISIHQNLEIAYENH